MNRVVNEIILDINEKGDIAGVLVLEEMEGEEFNTLNIFVKTEINFKGILRFDYVCLKYKEVHLFERLGGDLFYEIKDRIDILITKFNESRLEDVKIADTIQVSFKEG